MSRGQKLGLLGQTSDQSTKHPEEVGAHPQPGTDDRIEEILEAARQHLDIKQ